MGDFFQTIVDRDATETDASVLAETVLAWLVSQGIVEAARTDCVLGASDGGYAPGPHMEEWVDDPDEARRMTRGLKTNGLELITSKTVFWSVSTDYQPVCPRGDTPTLPDEWLDAAGEWEQSTGPALVPCPTCRGTYPVTEWSFEPGFAFGSLGFTFWNWPPFLSRRLIDAVGRLLSPHRVVLVYSSL